MKHSRRKGFQVIRDRLIYGRKAPLQARKHERKRGRDLTWTLRGMPAPEWVAENWPGSATVLAVRCQGSRDDKPVDETRYYVTSLRTSAKALLQHVRERWSIENSWHWPRDTQLKEDAHRYREVCQATLKTEPLPTPKTEPPRGCLWARSSEWFRPGGSGACCCSWVL